MPLQKGDKCTNKKKKGGPCKNDAEFETPERWCGDCWAEWWALITKAPVEQVKKQIRQ